MKHFNLFQIYLLKPQVVLRNQMNTKLSHKKVLQFFFNAIPENYKKILKAKARNLKKDLLSNFTIIYPTLFKYAYIAWTSLNLSCKIRKHNKQTNKILLKTQQIYNNSAFLHFLCAKFAQL